MSSKTTQLGLQLIQTRPLLTASKHVSPKSRCSLSTAALIPQTRRSLPSSTRTPIAANPSASTDALSSFFTPSLCRTRNASTVSAPPSSSSNTLDWNSFFRLRTSRRRYALTSSILTSIASTAAAVITFSEVPVVADTIPKIIPTDPFISMGVATFAATFLGWLIGPAFGNTIWRLLHRTRLPEFTIKERAFFERIKKHRVNPSGASTNNPVPDFYGEKVNSVAGYRRWLKDQRAFNRKRGGAYPSAV